jgi:hypothetical protein
MEKCIFCQDDIMEYLRFQIFLPRQVAFTVCSDCAADMVSFLQKTVDKIDTTIGIQTISSNMYPQVLLSGNYLSPLTNMTIS